MSVQRCGSCGATVRQGAPWCSLCYADLTAADAGETVARALALHDPVPPQSPAGGPRLAQQAPAESSAESPTWPCLICGAHNDFALVACHGCGAAFLGDPRGEGAGGRARGNSLARFSRGTRLAIAGLIAVLVTAVAGGIFLLLEVTGH